MATPMTVEAFRKSITLALGDAIIGRWPLCSISCGRTPCDNSSHAADKQIAWEYETVAEVMRSLTDNEVADMLDRLLPAEPSSRSTDELIALHKARWQHPSARGSRSRLHIVTPAATNVPPPRGPRPVIPLSEATTLLIRARAGAGDWRNGRCEGCGTWLGEGGACQPRTWPYTADGALADLDSPANGTLLCGTPFEGCRSRCERWDFDMAVAGFWLGPDEDPALTPIQWHGIGRPGLTLWLGADGSYQYEPPPRPLGQPS